MSRVDGFVDPSHRGRGLFTMTIEFMAQQLIGDGAELLIGFNLPGAAAAAVRAGSVEVGAVHQWILKKKLSERSREAAQVKVARSDIVELNRLHEDWAKTANYIHASRDLEYLDWRVARDTMSSHECCPMAAEKTMAMSYSPKQRKTGKQR